MGIPYFHGHKIQMPLVQLRHVETGQLVWVFNTHNPANSAGDAQHWRDAGFEREITLVKRLQRDWPGVPVIVTGDKNDREKYYCPVTLATDLQSANGGTSDDSGCAVTRPTEIDWVMGDAGVGFTNYRAMRGKLVRKTTDHPIIVSDASLTDTAADKRVLAVNVEGLRAEALVRLAPRLPTFTRLRAEGVVTVEGRTSAESVERMPNLIGMLTGRVVDRAWGGTGVGTVSDVDRSVHTAAGSYVSSIFDLAHDSAASTGLWTANRQLVRRVAASWGAGVGAPDLLGADAGTAKVAPVRVPGDKAAMAGITQDLRTQPSLFSFASLTRAQRVAGRFGPRSEEYAVALERIDRQLGALLDVIQSERALRRHTTLIVTSSQGAVPKRGLSPTNRRAYRVPFMVWRHKLAARPLYEVNPQLADPARTNPDYAAAAQPVRAMDLANLAASLLGLPSVPGSYVGADAPLVVEPEVTETP